MLNYIRETIMAPATRSSSANQNNNSKPQEPNKNVKPSGSKDSPPALMRGYKVTDNERTRKYGIGANSLGMLIEKANNKFPVSG